MSNPANTPNSKSPLRLNAELRLQNGNAPPAKDWGVNTDALELLYRLAVAPGSAGDAVKLLHELQTHQVELDLQHAQLMANEQEYVQQLDRYKTLFDSAPVGYFVVGREGRIIEGNLAAARLFGVEPDEFGDRPVHSFLTPGSRLAVLGLLKRLRDGGASASCEVQANDGADGSRPLRIVANMAPGNEAILMIISEPTHKPGA